MYIHMYNVSRYPVFYVSSSISEYRRTSSGSDSRPAQASPGGLHPQIPSSIPSHPRHAVTWFRAPTHYPPLLRTLVHTYLKLYTT